MPVPTPAPSTFDISPSPRRSPQSLVRIGRHLLASVLVLITFAVPARADDDGEFTGPPVPSEVHQTVLRKAWGSAAPTTVNLGMWTQHVDRLGVDNNRLYGGTYRGVFAATFLNSWHDRSYAVAIERRVAGGAVGPIGFDAAYRLGAIHGYDQRMNPVAGKTPVVPFVQAVGDAMWKNRIGVQATFCVKVVTWGAVVRF